jgi:hypothetical protein
MTVLIPSSALYACLLSAAVAAGAIFLAYVKLSMLALAFWWAERSA